MTTGNGGWMKTLDHLLRGVRTVFAFLALIDIGLLVTLRSIAPNLTASWDDPRPWLILLIISLLIGSVIIVLHYMKHDPSMLGEPQPMLKGVTITDSRFAEESDTLES